MKISKMRIVVITLTLIMALSAPFQGAFAMSPAGSADSKDNSIFEMPGHYSLSEITDKFANKLSGEEMLLYDAFVYRGWRTSSGHWLDAVMVDLHDKLTDIGFKNEERTTAGNQGDCVWYQYETGSEATTTTWNPQYASVTVVPSPGMYSIDRDTIAEKVDFVADCIDPTSMYYPSYVTPEWLVDALNDPDSPDYKKMQQVNDRCHLASDSPFTALTDPSKTVAENIAVGTKRAQVIDCGTVTKTSNSKGKLPSELNGKIILADGKSNRSYVRAYAAAVGAIASMCNQINGYNMPTIDGVQWYTNAAKYAAAGLYTANNVVAFNTSLDQYNALSALCADGPTYLDICALGTYESNQPVRCLVAEIQGSTKPEERIIVPSHINEPGACDNASGVAMNYEIVSKLKEMIDKGEIARPERTITFIWGDEIDMTLRWIAKYESEFNNFKGSIDLDMTGEDPDLTGGHMLIEKTPDPADVATDAVDASLLYRYGNNTYPGQMAPPPYSEFIRQPDKFSLWTGTVETSETPMNNYPGFNLNDLYLQTALKVQKSNPNFLVASNPYEGGSDHTPFVTAVDMYGAPVPALLTWHFTDYVYHSSCDTLDKLSVQEFHDVGLTSMSVIYQMANGNEYEVADTMDNVMASWETRLAEEMQNTSDHYDWQMENAPSDIDTAYNMELKAIADWSRWYIEAVRSPGKYMVGGTIGNPYKLSKALQDKQDGLVSKIQQDTINALNNVDTVFGKTSGSHPTQVASAYLPEPIFVPVGTSFEQLKDRLPSTVTIEYIGGGTGEADVTWDSSTFAPSTTRPSGLFRVTGTLSNLESGVVNPAVVLAVAEVNVAEVTISIPVKGISSGNGQTNVDFSVKSANGKGYSVYLSEIGDQGSFNLYKNVNFDSKGVHLKGLTSGKKYFAYVEYYDNGKFTRTETVTFTSSK
jgi:hypothetical protein